MFAYFVRRLIGAFHMLLLITLVTFGVFFWLPKPAGQSTDQIAAAYVGRASTPEAIEATRERLGLDEPVVVQYGRYLKPIAAGADYDAGPVTDHCPPPCLGYSFRSSQPVLGTLLDRAPATLSLAFGAAIIWPAGGIATSVLSALRRGSVWDRTAMIIALAGVSLPTYFTGLVTLALFSYTLKIFPGGGSYRPLTDGPVTWFEALVLPWVTLAFLYAAMYARLTRAGMLETMNEDYIRTARAKGVPEGLVVTRHALRSCLPPHHHGLRSRPRPAHRRRGADREHLQHPRPGPTRPDLGQERRPPHGPGRHPADVRLDSPAQPPRRPALRSHRPPRETHLTPTPGS
jgi:peptide/nickel transport system permease protein